MSAFNKLPESKMKIRFHDCDPFNHLNNSKYIDYLVTARTDQLLDHYNVDIYKLAREKSIGWVTAQTQISYIVPAFPEEEVTIQTQLIDFKEKSLLFEALMWDSNKTVLKAVMWTKLVHFNLQTQKSQSHSETLMQLFAEVVNPIVADAGFEKRVAGLRMAK
jgi:acyl-CoA thioester hydrolase